jgi:hypothetical protein
MSIIVNYPTNFLITRADYVNKTAADLYQRFQVESSVLPCIYNGLSVTSGGGFVANISAGTARGQDIQFTQMPTSTFLPINVSLIASTVTCPPSTSGWIVLNININPGPTVAVSPTPGGGTYNVQADNNAGTPVVGPVFVTSLQPAIGAVYPYTQIVLAAVTTDGSGITAIDMTGSNRSYDWSRSLNPIYVQTGGTANAITATSNYGFKSYFPGMRLLVPINTDNTSGTVTINLDGLGPKNLARQTGGAIAIKDLQATQVADVIYDGALFQLQNPMSSISPLQVLGDLGYIYLPGGIIMQYGMKAGGGTVTFPIPFPNGILIPWATINGDNANSDIVSIDGFTTTQMNVNTTGGADAWWYAMGF